MSQRVFTRVECADFYAQLIMLCQCYLNRVDHMAEYSASHDPKLGSLLHIVNI
jgi:hypothetical protein